MKPDHQQFQAGPFTIYSHNYDGDVLQLVEEGPKSGEGKRVAILESDLVAALQKLYDDKDKHVVSDWARLTRESDEPA